jgi:4-hydroxy-3-polyprenylbenzoate decarboxylase
MRGTSSIGGQCLLHRSGVQVTAPHGRGTARGEQDQGTERHKDGEAGEPKTFGRRAVLGFTKPADPEYNTQQPGCRFIRLSFQPQGRENPMKKRIIVALSGASGVVYGIRTLMHLRDMAEVESHLVLSRGACVNIRIETDYEVDDVEAMADVVYRPDNLAAAISSGSFRTEGMIVIPCTIKTLSGIVHSYADNLLTRAADVCLKEKRKLVLVVRETPLHKGHLELMVRAADLGARIVPPMPAFYHKPETIDDLIDQTIGKVFDSLGLDHHLFRRWEGRTSGSAVEAPQGTPQ